MLEKKERVYFSALYLFQVYFNICCVFMHFNSGITRHSAYFIVVLDIRSLTY